MPSAAYCVIGSGLAGVACARALLDSGAEVLMIDAGAECEDGKIEVVNRLAALEPARWSPEDLSAIQSDYLHARNRQAFKPVYGSEFPYAKYELTAMEQRGTKCLISHAKGGLSNVWGAAVLPAPAADFADWPFARKELERSYAEVGQMLDIAAESDDLEEFFPLYAPTQPSAPSSRQAQAFLSQWRANRERLKSSGIVFGNSRLALKISAGNSNRRCRLTGLCLSGCPYSAIYNSRHTLEDLQKNPNFRYEPGWIAEEIKENGEAAFVQCRPMKTGGSSARFEARRVFAACGALGTAKLILASTHPAAKLTLRYQPYFLLPVLAFSPSRGVDKEELHTLAQGFMEITDPGISSRLVHLQFYTYNSFIKDKVREILRLVPGAIAERVGPALWERLLVVQGYLNSQEGGTIALTAEKSDGAGLRLRLSGRLPASTRWKIFRVAAKLLRHSRAVGGISLLPFMELGMPGEGNHIGSVFPMTARPSGFESDLLGRVAGMRLTHAVDASVLPTLPATTISYTVMANAHRIALEAARLDGRP